MKAIEPYTQIFIADMNGQQMIEKIETVARTCYKSESRIAEGTAEKMVKSLVKNGHEAMLEHASVTVKFVCDRGISHELVRHRLASFAQESTRFCNYSRDDFGSEITFIIPEFLHYGSQGFNMWKEQMKSAEKTYFDMLDFGLTPQEARCVLPNSLKTEVVMTCNLREWRWFFKLRAAGVSGTPHPQMLQLTVPLLQDFQQFLPSVFDDIKPCKSGEKYMKKDGESNDF